MTDARKTVAIIGAGPVGLAAAAHAIERNLNPVVFEAGPEVGYAVREWSHVQLFSPWAYNIDKAAARLLAEAGWNTPDPSHYSTGGELLEGYLKPLAKRLKDHIRTAARVTGISRVGFDKVKTKGREAAPFEIRYQNGAGSRLLPADAVIDARGTSFSPNSAGANGLPAIGETGASAGVAYGMPDILGRDRDRYVAHRVAVLGSGHSAVGSLIDLAKLGEDYPWAEVRWLIRGADPAKAFGGGENDALAARGELGATLARLVEAERILVETEFRVTSIAYAGSALRIEAAGGRSLDVDELIVATGFRPDFSFLSEIRLALDPALECPPELAALIDPNDHSCGTVRPHGARELSQPEPGFYFAGMKSYGRAPTFLMLTGYEQVRSIIADIAGDHEAAERVELVLPESGVCNASRSAESSGGCCGGPPKANTSACCVKDEEVKASGGSGCGCSSGKKTEATAEPALA